MLHKHGCIVLDARGKVIAEGYNTCLLSKKLPVNRRGAWSTHAEAAAARQLPKRKLRGTTFIVVRVNMCGDLVNSEPCDLKCKRMLRSLGVAKVYYS